MNPTEQRRPSKKTPEPIPFLRRLFRSARTKFDLRRTAMPRLTMPPPGTAAGIETDELSHRLSGAEPVHVTCIDYAPDQVQVQTVTNIGDFIAHHRPEWSRVRWINIDGLTDMDVVRAFAEKYQLHPLAIEDVLHTVQRPKVEDYPSSADLPGRLFVVARAIEQQGERPHFDQISCFLGRKTLITFQEMPGDAFDPIRQRLQTPGSRLRQNDVSFLLYALLDAIVDHYFPLLERYSERLEEVEEQLLDRPKPEALQHVHAIKRELLLLRRAAWPMRELMAVLQREKHECLSETAQTYLRDVYDHCVQIIDLIETYREIAAALTETYISIVSNRTNEIMKVLTIMGTIFIPLTFLAGVYGMNMPIPENQWPAAYPVFWAFCVLVAGGMLLWFRRRGWL
jgi:magnesium transporter